MPEGEVSIMGERLTHSYQYKNTPKIQIAGTIPSAPAKQNKKNVPSIKSDRYKSYTRFVDRAIPVFLHTNFYNSEQKSKFPFTEKHAEECTAIKLSTMLINHMGKELIKGPGSISENENFYHRCIEIIEADKVINNFEDIEILIITLQQLSTIISLSGIIESENQLLKYSSSPSCRQIYIKLFSAFWNKVPWKKLFLSMPETATALQLNKKKIAFLLSQKSSVYRLEDLAKEIIKTLDLGSEKNLLLISFLDFYLFTWLGYFGIINYLEGQDNDPVEIQITSCGRKFLALL